MKVLGICCSGRLHGNTERMLQEALNQAKETGAEVELFPLAGKHIVPCDGCGSCQETGKGCHIKDDIREVIAKIVEADGVIFGSPVYILTVTGQAKVLLDRCISLRGMGRTSSRKKVGGVIVTTGRVGANSAVSVFRGFFAHRWINAGAAMGFTGAMKEDKVKGPTPKDRILSDKVAMREAGDLGRAVVRRIRETYIIQEAKE